MNCSRSRTVIDWDCGFGGTGAVGLCAVVCPDMVTVRALEGSRGYSIGNSAVGLGARTGAARLLGVAEVSRGVIDDEVMGLCVD